jgi:NAD(P)-dependent dehydrogenase (short-subunit alcohol dehydrogenase family)
MRLKGKTALITGGNSGIGFATARRFVDEGARVVVTGRDPSTLDRAQSELGPRVTVIQANVIDRVAREGLFASIKEKFGHLDVVFANAGIAKQGSIADTPEELFDEVLKVNVTGVFLTVQAALPLMRDGGSIILNSSIAATAGMAGSGAYAGSKAAVKAMAHSFASELAPRGIRVNSVVPGIIRTPIWGRNSTQEAGEARAEKLLVRVPFKRFGEADDIANAVLFLASDESAYVHSTEIIVDGGMTGSPGGAIGR